MWNLRSSLKKLYAILIFFIFTDENAMIDGRANPT